MIKNIVNLGDAAIYCDFGYEVNKEINSKVIKYFRALRQKNLNSFNTSFNTNSLVRHFKIKCAKGLCNRRICNRN